MGIYSTNVFNGTLNSGQVSVYTVPTNSVFVIRDIELYNGDAGSVGINIQCSVSGQDAMVWKLTATSATWYQWAGRVAMPAAAEILTYGGGSTLVLCIISGYLLT